MPMNSLSSRGQTGALASCERAIPKLSMAQANRKNLDAFMFGFSGHQYSLI
jgi:hypothetical protein